MGFHTHALALLGHTQYESSLKRREVIRPSLKKEYAALCSPNVPVTSLLFGNDLQQQLNKNKASNKISQAFTNTNKSQQADYKGSLSGSRWHRSSNQYYKRSFHSQNQWRNRGHKSKNLNPPFYKKKGGQELNTTVNELTNIETLQVSKFESNVVYVKQLLLFRIQCFKAGSIRKFYLKWTDLTSDPEVLATVKGQFIEFPTTPYQDRVPEQKKFIV